MAEDEEADLIYSVRLVEGLRCVADETLSRLVGLAARGGEINLPVLQGALLIFISRLLETFFRTVFETAEREDPALMRRFERLLG